MKTICPHCNQRYDVEHIYNGATAYCEECNHEFVVTPDVDPKEDLLLKNLNTAQIQAVLQTSGYVRVVAGPGTGKTRVLTHRLAHLIKNLEVSPSEILSVTFTNKAAKEMELRIKKMLGDNIRTRIQTFHGFCNTVLREDIFHIRFPRSYVIMDIEDQKSLVKESMDQYGFTLKDFSFKIISKAISDYKYSNNYPSLIATDTDIRALAFAEEEPLLKIVMTYIAYQKQRYILDYDDLIVYTLYIFKEFPEVLEKWQTRLSYIQVDEFQDVNSSHYELVSLLAEKHRNLFIVGDPDQTIYGWRGAKVQFFLDFPADYTIKLQENYRSTPQIIDSYNKLIKHNTERIENKIIATRESGSEVQFYNATYYNEQAKWVVNHIKDLSTQYSYSDFVILCRALYITRSFEEWLIKNHIPYHIYNGIDFYRRKEIKDALSYLRLASQNDDLSFCRIINVPPRGIGKRRLEYLKNLAANNKMPLFDTLHKNMGDSQFQKCTVFVKTILEMRKLEKTGAKISDILDYVLTSLDYTAMIRNDSDEERLTNLQELVRSINELELDGNISLEEYLSNISLYSERNEKQGMDCVKIMTIHNAKGLEFPCVFVVSLNEGVLPSQYACEAPEIEEERRVAYVALSRAKEKLFLSTDLSFHPFGYDYDAPIVPSRFLSEIGFVEKELTVSSNILSDNVSPKNNLKILRLAPRPRFGEKKKIKQQQIE